MSESVDEPEELTTALDADDRARAIYAALPPSHRREYARWVADALKPVTRRRRAEKAVERLKSGSEGPDA